MQLDTSGRNPHVLAALVKENLCDKIVFTLHGPAARYGDLTGLPLAPPQGTGLDMLTSPQLFKYRTQCRRFMVRAEIMKTD